MRLFFAGSMLLLAVVGCQRRPANPPGAGADMETGAKATDTVVTQQKTQDTTMITHDTAVKTDTSKKRGGVVSKDTVKKP